MRRLLVIIPATVACMLLAGCARTPSNPSTTVPTRQLIVHFTLAAAADPNYYYFIAVDANGDANDGPVPIVANPSAPVPATGVPLIISDSANPPGFYLQYYHRAFYEYKDLVYAGPPFQAAVSTDGRTVTVTMDLDSITTTANQIELNIITADRLLPSAQDAVDLNYDGLGASGTSYLTVPITVSGTYTNADAAFPETSGDTTIGALDITDWSVEVRLTG